jgi:hypothetical protein
MQDIWSGLVNELQEAKRSSLTPRSKEDEDMAPIVEALRVKACHHGELWGDHESCINATPPDAIVSCRNSEWSLPNEVYFVGMTLSPPSTQGTLNTVTYWIWRRPWHHWRRNWNRIRRRSYRTRLLNVRSLGNHLLVQRDQPSTCGTRRSHIGVIGQRFLKGFLISLSEF